MGDYVTLRREVLGRFMAIMEALGGGRDLDDVLELVAKAVVDVIGFDAVAVNIRTWSGDLRVQTVVGPPELEALRGGTLSHSGWLDLLDSGEPWGELRFLRTVQLDEDIPHVDPWRERLVEARPGAAGDDTEPWQPEFALLAPMWLGPEQLSGVISVDMPRSGRTPNSEQRALLELFAKHAGAAVERVRAVALANDGASLYRAAFSASPAPTAVLDEALRLIDMNASFLDMADALESDLLGRALTDVIVLDDPDRVLSDLALLASDQGMVVGEECPLRHPRGHSWERWVHVAVRRVDGLAADARYVCIVADRTSDRASMNEMRRRAEHDQLTGLKVRSVGLSALERMSAQFADGPGLINTAAALLFCDLDDFKSVNDTAGHLAGDRVLVQIAQLLERYVDECDVVCRWGGDEFGVVLSRPSLQSIVDVAHELVDAVRTAAANAADDDPIRLVGLSVGIAVFEKAADPHEIVLAADAALYRSKTHDSQRVHHEVL
ncbi:sensor domain-containing diguanylate cyclase [Mycolicibacterium sp.]|uniref:GGDEF domain-containing protein n=1 Tax=Mycolicibacterium sp. TaxID=2320850 RepID=UPI001A220EFB|nr:sensor domain-containing diguanylate cyclase [Mycolicibacterium sp.]MBJ7341509.1 GGDEF domain-containing protein [Mycolicibacterium sp.]